MSKDKIDGTSEAWQSGEDDDSGPTTPRRRA